MVFHAVEALGATLAKVDERLSSALSHAVGRQSVQSVKGVPGAAQIQSSPTALLQGNAQVFGEISDKKLGRSS